MLLSKNLRCAVSALIVAMSIVAIGTFGFGCGGEQPAPAPQAAPTAAPSATDTAAPAPAVEKPAEKPAAPVSAPVTAAPAAAAEGAPLTYEVLQLTPALAQVAVALPPMNGTLAKAIPFAKRIAPPEIDIDKELENIVQDLAADTGVSDAKTLNDIALAKGIDFNAPMAVFADFAASVDSAVKSAEENAKATAAPAAPAPSAGGDQTAAAPAEPAAPVIDPDDLDMPALAVVLGVSDKVKAEATLKELVALDSDLSGKTFEEVKVGDIAIQSIAPYGYFFAGNKIAVGNLDLVKGIAERVASPAKIRYGTAECPATSKDEGSALLFGGRALPLIQKVMPFLKMDENMQSMLKAQMVSMEMMLSGDGGEDPLVATLSWTDDALELQARMDTATHPGVLTVSGPPAPLKLAQLLPESTLGMVALRLTEEYKKQITDVYLKSVPAELSEDPGFAQGVTIGKQVLTMLGDEITLGVTGIEADFPAVVLMIKLANVESTKGLLQMLVPTMEGEKYGDIDIQSIAAPIPIPLSIAYVGDMVMLSNNIDQMKKIIDLNKDGKTTGLFASFQPPMDPALPRYNAVVVDSKLATDVVMPLAALLGGGLGDAQPTVEQVTKLVRQVRMMSEMNGSWQASKVTVYLKPVEAAAPVAPAEASK